MTITEEVSTRIHGIVEVSNLPREVKKAQFATTRTVILSASKLYDELLSGPDLCRSYVTVFTVDTPFVLCTSLSDAQSGDNATANLPNPRGALVPTNFPIRFCATNRLWVATYLTGANLCRISVITEHLVRG